MSLKHFIFKAWINIAYCIMLVSYVILPLKMSMSITIFCIDTTESLYKKFWHLG